MKPVMRQAGECVRGSRFSKIISNKTCQLNDIINFKTKGIVVQKMHLPVSVLFQFGVNGRQMNQDQ